MTMPLQQFTLFSHLPTEIRLKIWRLCLPRRVLEINYIDDDVDYENPKHGQFCFDTRKASDENCLPPLLLRVCRESRQVALEKGQVETFGEWATWRQPHRDKLLLWHMTMLFWFSSSGEYWHNHYAKNLPDFFAWARRANMTPCIYHILIHHFVPAWGRPEVPVMGSPQASQLAVLASLTRNSVLPVSLKTIILHVTKEDAAQSGLFGIFGEDTVQLVDANDHKELDAYHEFWSSHAVEKSPVVTAAFNTILAEETFRADVAKWIEKANFILLAAVWNAARSSGSGDVEYPEDIWSPKVPPNEFPNINVHAVDDSHPWVVQTRAELPVLLPRVNFRCCWYKECFVKCGAIPEVPERPPSPLPDPLYNRHRPGSSEWTEFQGMLRRMANAGRYRGRGAARARGAPRGG